MRTITIALPDQPLGDVEMTDDELTEEIRMLAAVKLYELGRISSGRAAEFAGISRVGIRSVQISDSGRVKLRLKE